MLAVVESGESPPQERVVGVCEGGRGVVIYAGR